VHLVPTDLDTGRRVKGIRSCSSIPYCQHKAYHQQRTCYSDTEIKISLFKVPSAKNALQLSRRRLVLKY